MRCLVIFLSCFCICVQSGIAQELVYESGGELTPELSAYNVHHYDLDLEILPADSTVYGTVGVYFEVVHPTNVIALALDPRLSIERVTMQGDKEDSLRFIRTGKDRTFKVYFPTTLQPGESMMVEVRYGGKPIVAANPPWDGGLVWDQTPSGEPWIGVATQTIGAWVWWPNKDHPSDRPDSVAIDITMPKNLIVASNGRSRGATDRGNGLKTWHWFVSTPINNYNITFNAAPYETISDTYTSIAGEEMEMTFWVLPEFEDEGRELFSQFSGQMEFLENLLGPYPFRADKYGVAHAPYLGMEHQTLIAYGAGFEDGALFGGPAKFDDLHHHELAHEWWGNLVTVWDWRDFWIHEGFSTYMQALYAEHVSGKEDYRKMIRYFEERISSSRPTAPLEQMTTVQITGGGRGGDVYYKGAAFLHTLRNYLGDEKFLKSLRRFTYPTPKMEEITDGSHMRFVTTNDYQTVVEQVSGEDLEWMFDVYLRDAELPVLTITNEDDQLHLNWNIASGKKFPMPVEVHVGGEIHRVTPDEEGIYLDIEPGQSYEIDPEGRILMIISEEEQ